MTAETIDRQPDPGTGGRASPAAGAGARMLRAALDPSFVAFLLVSLALALAFVFSPELDLEFQALFYREGEGFFLKDSLFPQAFYWGIRRATVPVVGVLILLLLASAIGRVRARGVNPKVVAVLLLTVGIGPGLVVNALFKDNWGRARPSQIVEFGGTKRFTPAFVPSDQCTHNCSFVAGHPSMVFAAFAAALMLRRRRRAAVAGVAVLGGLAGLGRILQGGHFLSDTVFSGVFVFLVAWALVNLFPGPRTGARTSARP